MQVRRRFSGRILLEQVPCGAHIHHTSDANVPALGARAGGLVAVAWTDIHRPPTDAVDEAQCQYLRGAAAQSRPDRAGRQRFDGDRIFLLYQCSDFWF